MQVQIEDSLKRYATPGSQIQVYVLNKLGMPLVDAGTIFKASSSFF